MTTLNALRRMRFAGLFSVVTSGALAGERTIEWEGDVAAPVAAVWAANTTKEGVQFLLSGDADVDWRLGGTIRMRTGSDAKAEEFVTRILAYEPNRMAAMVAEPTAGSNGAPAEWYVAYFSELSPGHTHLRFVEVAAKDSDDREEHARAFRRENDAVLARTREFVSRKSTSTEPSSPTPPALRSVITESVVPAPIDDVWGAFTTKEGVESWMVPVADVDFRLGGTIRTNYDAKAKIGDPGTIVQHILAYEPKRMIAMRFDVPATAPQLKVAEATWSVVTLDKIDATSTKVRFAQLGFGEGPEWDVAYRHFEAGNPFTMRKLVERFEKPKR